jgi:hypothetical protein
MFNSIYLFKFPPSLISHSSHAAHGQSLLLIKIASFMTTHAIDKHCTTSCFIFITLQS